MPSVTRRSIFQGLGTIGFGAALARSDLSWAEEKRFRIAFANIDDTSAFGASVLASIKEAAKRRPSVDLRLFDNRNDAARAVENARTIATSKYDLFVQYNGQAASNSPIAKIMADADIKVLAVQVTVPNAPLFAVDNPASGSDSGRALAEEGKRRWPSETPIVIIVGLPEAGPLFRDRGEAAKRAIAQFYPNVTFEEFSSKVDVGYVRQTTTDLLTRHLGKKILIWAHVDDMALAVVSAVRNANRVEDAVVATTGGGAAAFPEMRRSGSPLLGTYSFFPELWGDDIFDIAGKMLRGEAVPARSLPRRQLFITAQNLAQFYPAP